MDFEKYVNQFDNTVAAMRDRCDYLLVDATDEHNKIAFCDLTCSEEKYVNPNDGKYPLGKRAKASSQMRKSLASLLILLSSVNRQTKRIIRFTTKVPEMPDSLH